MTLSCWCKNTRTASVLPPPHSCTVHLAIIKVFYLDSSWNVMAHGDAREGKWRRNWRMEWVASTLHTTSEHGLSSITTTDEHTSAANSGPNWRLRRFKWTRSFRRKTKIWILRVCHHISTGLYETDAQENYFKRVLKFTLKQLQHVSVWSPSSGSVTYELAKVTVLKHSIKIRQCG